MSATGETTRPTFHVEPAEKRDLPQIHSIYTYYVQNTTIVFAVYPPSIESLTAKYHSIVSANLPYLVALAAEPPTAPERQILGFAYAAPFNPTKLGYAISVEVTLYVHPEHLAKGIGTALMGELLRQLQQETYRACEPGYEAEEQVRDVKVENVFAIVSQDVAGRGGWASKGEANREWYVKRFGFEEVGVLKGVGEKFGRRLGVAYLQKRLGD